MECLCNSENIILREVIGLVLMMHSYST